MPLLYLFLFLFLASSAAAQSGLSAIKGTVTDEHSEATIPGVNVVVVGTDPLVGTTTDLNGRFRLDGLPAGRHTLQFTFMGYEPVTMGNLLLNSGKELDVNAALRESITDLGEVVISAETDRRENLNKMNTVSTRQFSVEETQRYSGALQDPARMAQNFAGVSGASDSRNDIIIRGNSPTGVLWRLEGIDIPSPNHFSTIGTTGGPVSMLNINNLANSEFMTSAWSPEFGNALSGVFDLRLRSGNSDKHEFLGQVGFNGFELGAEGPMRKGGLSSYLVNYRYSTLGVFGALGVDLGTGTAVPEYQDLTFKINMPTKKAGHFTVWGIGGFSYIEFDPDGNDSTNLYSDGKTRTRFGSQTAVAGASHQYYFNADTYYKLVVAASTTQNGGTGDSVGVEDTDLTRIFGFDRAQSKLSANLKFNRKVNARHTVALGAIADRFAFDFVDSNRVSGNTYNVSSDFSGNANLFQAYAQWQARATERLTINSGLHGQWFELNGALVAEPRVGARWQLNNKNTISGGAGLHSQMQPITVYFVADQYTNGQQYLPNKHLGFTRAIHTVVGHELSIGTSTRLKTEVYYQWLQGVPIDSGSSSFSMLNTGADFAIPNRTGLQSEGTGRNYGVEFTLERFFNRGYYYLLTTSLYESFYTGSDGVERNTLFNGNYVVNLLAGKEFALGKKATLSFDTKVTVAGGRRYTPIDLVASRASGSEVRLDNKAFSEQLDDYFRPDFKITFRHNGRRTAQQFSVDLQNFVNQQNVFQYGYNASTGEVGTVYQRGFFPDVQYKIFF